MGNEKIKYLYITGMGRSGSTLLSFLLNSHKQMVSIGESEGVGKRVCADRNFPCSCGVSFLQCPFYLKLERLVNEFGSPFSLMNWTTNYSVVGNRWLEKLLSRPLGDNSLEYVRDIFVSFWPGYQKKVGLVNNEKINIARAVLAISDKQVFVDASKDSANIKFLQKINQLDLYVIHLVRDVRGVVNSVLKKAKEHNVSLAARQWKRTNMNCCRAMENLPPDRFFQLTYDEMCADPKAMINRIADFVGVEQVNILENFYEVVHHIQGNYMRLKHVGEINKDDSWKKHLTAHDLGVIAEVAGKANRHFGHDWP